MSDPEAYDTPRPAQAMNYDSPRPWSRTSQLNSRMEESYDVPRSVSILSQQNMTPSSSNSSLLTADSHSISSSNRSSLVNMPDYDIPRRFPNSGRSSTSLMATSSSNHFQSTYDIPISNQPKVYAIKELPLELTSALDTLAKLEGEATGAINK